MRVLVTGAAGFIGSHVTRILVSRGDEVIVLERPGADKSRISDVVGRLEYRECDLGDTPLLQTTVSQTRPEMCAHMAWYTVHGKYWHAPENLDCVMNSLVLVRLLADCGCKRILVAGTCAEYDWSHERLIEGVTPCIPRTLYGASKYALFLMLEKFCAMRSMPLAWPRYNFIYGPGEHPARLVPTIVRKLLSGKDVPLTHGLQKRDFLYVEDVASATVAVLKSSVCGPVNIGSGQPVAIREVAETISRIIGGSGRLLFGAVPVSADEPDALMPDVGRLNNEVGWQHHLSLAEGIQRTIDSFRDGKV